MSEIVNKKIEEYIEKNSSKESKILKDLNKETNLKILNPRMLSGHLQGRFLSIISRLVKPKKILEIGTYTGYSAICLSEGLVKNGIIHTIDINEELNTIQSKYIKKTNNSNSIIQHVVDEKEVIKKIDEIFDEIQRSNMSKLDNNGNPIFREDGKVLKGPNYFRPNIKKILKN